MISSCLQKSTVITSSNSLLRVDHYLIGNLFLDQLYGPCIFDRRPGRHDDLQAVNCEREWLEQVQPAERIARFVRHQGQHVIVMEPSGSVIVSRAPENIHVRVAMPPERELDRVLSLAHVGY